MRVPARFSTAPANRPASTIRWICFRGTPVTDAASFADKASLGISIVEILPAIWNEYRARQCGSLFEQPRNTMTDLSVRPQRRMIARAARPRHLRGNRRHGVDVAWLTPETPPPPCGVGGPGRGVTATPTSSWLVAAERS